MPWGGYNFEDAILVSEKLHQGRHLHLDPHRGVRAAGARHQARRRGDHARDPERVARRRSRTSTRRASSASARACAPGDILVGKVTPKGETGAVARGAPAQGDLRREGRRRARRLAQGAPGHGRHRHRHQGLLAARRRTTSTKKQEKKKIEKLRRAVARRSASASSRCAWPSVCEICSTGSWSNELVDARRRARSLRASRQASSPPSSSPRSISTTCRGALPIDRRTSKVNERFWRARCTARRRALDRVEKELEKEIEQGHARRRAAARRGQAGQGLRRQEAQALGRRQDGRPPRQQGRGREDPARGGHAVPAGRHAGRDRAEPARRAVAHEHRPDPGDAPGLGGARARLHGRDARCSPAPRWTRSRRAARGRACPRTARPMLLDGRTGERVRPARHRRLHLHDEAVAPGRRQDPRPLDRARTRWSRSSRWAARRSSAASASAKWKCGRSRRTARPTRCRSCSR